MALLRRGEQVILGEAFIVGEPLTQIIGELSQIPGLASTILYLPALQLRAGIPEGAIILAFANKALTLLQAEDYI